MQRQYGYARRRGRIVMYDKLKARELMAIAGGELKPRHEHKHSFDHAAFLGAEPPDGDDE